MTKQEKLFYPNQKYSVEFPLKNIIIQDIRKIIHYRNKNKQTLTEKKETQLMLGLEFQKRETFIRSMLYFGVTKFIF